VLGVRGGEGKGGGQLSAAWGQEKEQRGGGAGFGDVGRHSTDTAVPGCSDSGGWRTPHGRGGHGCDRGGRWGATTRARVADRWGAMTRGPGGSGWVREAARRGALTCGPRPQCRAVALANRRARAAWCWAAWIQTGFKNISNGFKKSPNFD
jgi:hypothetical protein